MKLTTISSIIAIAIVASTSQTFATSANLYGQKGCSITSSVTLDIPVKQATYDALFVNAIKTLPTKASVKDACQVMKDPKVVEVQKDLEGDIRDFIFFYTLSKASKTTKETSIAKFNAVRGTNYTISDITFNMTLLKASVKTNKVLLSETIQEVVNEKNTLSKSKTIETKVDTSKTFTVSGTYLGDNRTQFILNGKRYWGITMYYSTLTEDNVGKAFTAKLKGNINSFEIIDIQFDK